MHRTNDLQTKQYIELCSDLLSNEFHAQLIHPDLEKVLGEKPARFLSQLHYWLNKCGKEIDGSVWIYNTVKEWKENFVSYSESTIRRILKRLEELGLITSKKFNTRNWNQCKSYSICYAKLADLLIIAKSDSTPKKSEKCCSNPHNSAFVQNEHLKLFNLNTSYTKTNKTNNNNNLSCEKEEEIDVESTVEEVPVQNIQQTEEKEISKDMISVWNEIISKEKIYHSSRREKKLLTLWYNHLEQDIEKWKEFCIAKTS